MNFKDYYEILGVSRRAPQEESRKAYRDLARRLHPDVSSEDGSQERFKDVGEAYEILKDSEKRARYDEYEMAWKQANGNVGPQGFCSRRAWAPPSLGVFSTFSCTISGLEGRRDSGLTSLRGPVRPGGGTQPPITKPRLD